MALGGCQVTQPQVVEDQDVGPLELGQDLGVRAVRLGQRELVEEPRDTSVEGAQTTTTGALLLRRGPNGGAELIPLRAG
jgi:hypothetical protein